MIKIKKYNSTIVSKKYLKWLKDPEVIKYTDQKNKKITLNTIKKFLKKTLESKDSYIFKILYKKNHIGNIKIGPIDFLKKTAPIGYIIGEKKYWNKGLATLAIKKTVELGKKYLKLKSIYSKVNKFNIGSCKALEKNNFKLVKIKKGRNRKFKIFFKKLN